LIDYNKKKETIQKDIEDVESRIQRGENGVENGVENGDVYEEPIRPDAEPLTPPPVESPTPPGEPENDVYDPPAPEALPVSPPTRMRSVSDSNDNPAKRRKLDSNHDEFAAFVGDKGGLGELDPDVEAMLAD